MSAISYIITTYNRPHSLLLRAMQSIIAERIDADSELIVVDDCSVEAAFIPPSVKAAFSGQVELIRNVKRKGVIGSRNVGLVAAQHPYLLFLDDDDMAYSNRSHDLLAAIDSSLFDFVAARTRMYHSDFAYKIVPPQYDAPLSPLQYLANPPHINGVIWRRSALLGIGGFDHRVPYFGEHITALCLILRGSLARQTHEVVAQFQYQNDGLTAKINGQNLMQQHLRAFYEAILKEDMSDTFRQICLDIQAYLNRHPIINFESYLQYLNQILNEKIKT